MNKTLIFFIMIIILPVRSFSADWRPVGGGNVDISSYLRLTNGNVAFWYKVLNADSSQSRVQFEIDCQKNKLRTLAVISHHQNGNLKEHESEISPWNTIIPDSVGEKLAELCHLPSGLLKDWPPVKITGSNWIEMGAAALDTDTIDITDRNTRLVWLNIPSKSGGDIARHEIDCKTNKFRIIAISTYNNVGKTLSIYFAKSSADGWSNVQSGKMSSTLVNLMCNEPQMP